MRYFIGNWKMFGVPKSINILNKINSFHSKDKNRKKYRVIITPPYTLIETFSNNFKKKKNFNWISKLLSKRTVFIRYRSHKSFYDQKRRSKIHFNRAL